MVTYKKRINNSKVCVWLCKHTALRQTILYEAQKADIYGRYEDQYNKIYILINSSSV